MKNEKSPAKAGLNYRDEGIIVVVILALSDLLTNGQR
jgi:hypothetical protein